MCSIHRTLQLGHPRHDASVKALIADATTVIQLCDVRRCRQSRLRDGGSKRQSWTCTVQIRSVSTCSPARENSTSNQSKSRLVCCIGLRHVTI